MKLEHSSDIVQAAMKRKLKGHIFNDTGSIQRESTRMLEALFRRETEADNNYIIFCFYLYTCLFSFLALFHSLYLYLFPVRLFISLPSYSFSLSSSSSFSLPFSFIVLFIFLIVMFFFFFGFYYLFLTSILTGYD